MTSELGDVAVRAMTDGDVPSVVELLRESLGAAPGGADRERLFRWKHLDNHFGRSLALVAEVDGRLAGLRAFMRWELDGPHGSRRAVRAVDTATSPSFQRRGVFSALTREALERCRHEGVDFVFNTPNDKSLPGYLKMGWVRVTRWPVRARVRRPAAFAGAVIRRQLAPGGPVDPPPGSPLVPARDAFEDEAVAALVEGSAVPSGALATPRTLSYLRWRYARAPMPYFVLVEAGALAVVRIRSRGRLVEAVVNEVLAPPGAVRGAARVLRAVARASGAHHAVAHFGREWPAAPALGRAGFLPLPGQGVVFTVRALSQAPPDPKEASSWCVALGDLEVF